MRGFFLVGVFCLVFCGLCNATAEELPKPAGLQNETLKILSPTENEAVIGKRPKIIIAVSARFEKGGLIVLLDNTDITGVLDPVSGGFEHTPIEVLQPGQHTLSVKLRATGSPEVQKELRFSVRHSAGFETFYSSNELTTLYEGVLTKPDSGGSLPNSKVEANLRSNTTIKEKNLESALAANLRYIDQSLPLQRPMQKGLDTANWQFNSTYTKDGFRFRTSIGDIDISETQNTIMGFNRKGGKAGIDYADTYQLNAFSVKSPQIMGLRGGLGIGDDADNHIIGASAGIKLFERKAEIRGIYATGGEQGSSFGISTITPARQRGDVLGLLMITDFFQNRLRTEAELDMARYDADTSDEFRKKTDRAYRLKFLGTIDRYNYEAMFERVGRDYSVIGNPGVQKDKEGITLRGGAFLGIHNINLSLAGFRDNIKGDSLYPRIHNYQGMIDYAFNKIPDMPVGISYQKSIQDSSGEPEGASRMNLHTDIVTGRISYRINSLNIGFQTMYSKMNDKTTANNDSRIMNYTFTPSFSVQDFSLNPSVMLNKAKSMLTDITTDTYTVSMDLRSNFFNRKFSFDLGGTYSIMKADNGSMDSKNLNANFRFGWNIKEFFRSLLNPTLAVRGVYSKNTDKLYAGANRDELTLFLVLTTSTPFSL